MDSSEQDVGVEAEDTTSSPSAVYLSSFQSHVEDTRDHLLGINPSFPLDPSHMDSTTFWTPSEKDLFFHALTIHSRLRPDLIAAEVGTKNLVEVTTYIDTLEDALVEEAGPRMPFALDYPVMEEAVDWEAVPRVEREAFPFAVEVSEEWCKFEEEQAAILTVLEPVLLARTVERTHQQLIEAQRSTLRKKRVKTEEGERDRRGEKERKKELDDWVEGKQGEWKMEKFTNRLDGLVLAAMDMMLRENEDERLFRPFPADPSATPTPLGDPSTSTQLRGVTSRENEDPLPSPVSVSSKTTISQEDLSPASRRRLYKRMYMRRKRAEKAGKDLDKTLVRLKPGRKAKQVAPAASVVDDSDEDEEEEVASQSYRHPHKSGLTAPYKVRAAADELGINAEWMRNQGLDLLKLSNCYKLMRIYNELHDVDPVVVSSISATVLSSLQARVVQFVRRVVKKACLSRSFERQTKARTKVWRISEKPIIRRKNVKHALGMYTDKKLCKRRHFRRLCKSITLERVLQPTASSTAAGSDEENQDGDEDENAELEIARLRPSTFKPSRPTTAPLTFEREVDLTKRRMPLPIRHLSTLRTVLPPDVYPLCEWEAEVDPTRQGFLESRRETEVWPTPWGEPRRPCEDTCLESDEEAFDEEMDNEEGMDLRDELEQEKFEAMLWEGEGRDMPRPFITPNVPTTANRKRQRDDEPEEEMKSGSEHEDEDLKEASPPKRTRVAAQRSNIRRKTYKSKEYISESDVD